MTSYKPDYKNQLSTAFQTQTTVTDQEIIAAPAAGKAIAIHGVHMSVPQTIEVGGSPVVYNAELHADGGDAGEFGVTHGDLSIQDCYMVLPAATALQLTSILSASVLVFYSIVNA